MFSKSKSKDKKKTEDKGDMKTKLAQFGLLDMEDVSTLDTNDDDLEAELYALTSGGKKQNKKVKKLTSPEDLDRMVADCMRDDAAADVSDEEDPDLLAELNALGPGDSDDESSSVPEESSSITGSGSESASIASPTQPSPVRNLPTIVRPSNLNAGHSVTALLNERIAMYEEAEQNSIAAGESSRAKRFTRGLKTLNQMLKSIKAGRAINEEDIPPAVITSSSRSNSNRDVSQPVTNTIPQSVAFSQQEGPTLEQVIQLQNAYKVAALSAKKEGDSERAIHFMRIFKQLNPLVSAAKQGQPIDISSLPTHPETYLKDLKSSTSSSNYVSSTSDLPKENQSLVRGPETPAGDEIPPQAAATAPSPPTSVLDALEQRLEKYIQQRDKAKSEENSRKQRMNERIMKQYQDAIKTHKAGKAINFEDLPTPPGFAAIPAGGSIYEPLSAPQGVAPPTAVLAPASSSSAPAPTKVARQAPAPPSAPANVRMAPKSRVERQLSLLEKRQKLFKDAALEAKRKGEIEQAKEYLRNFKGFDQLILATSSGLPVDMNTVPIPPQEMALSVGTSQSLDFEMVNEEDCIAGHPSTPADIALIYTKLEEDLIEQIKMCARTREHFKALGDVASANKFEHEIVSTKKDLDAVRAGFKRGDTPPRFHYEKRTFTMIQCNTDLNDSDCEVTILRGINLNVPNPKEVDTMVKIEFPYPAETPPQGKTEIVKDTNCPEFNHKSVFSIDRKVRALSRVFKRHSIKCQVICKGGWFHRDTVLGSVKVPLITLENKCTLHESFDLLDDRKKMVGGKLEVKIRVRNPILSKQLEKVTEKWVVINHN